jgi:hypothetical protein
MILAVTGKRNRKHTAAPVLWGTQEKRTIIIGNCSTKITIQRQSCENAGNRNEPCVSIIS